MDHTNRADGQGVARSLAKNGDYGSWQAVETRMQQLGFYHADLWFSDRTFRGEISALCEDSRPLIMEHIKQALDRADGEPEDGSEAPKPRKPEA